MRSRKCNLELQLLPLRDSYHQQQFMEEEEEPSGSRSRPGEQQKLTIFYNGRVCVWDVTELQAREILSLATREMEETMKTTPTSSLSPVSATTPSTKLSMKKSLQRFLQKRKNRVQSSSPYNNVN